MACPLFLPSGPLSSFEDAWRGDCAAQPGVALPVDQLRHCCNIGYAREACKHAAGSEADAFRFLIKSERDGAVEVAWSSERDHHPLAVGTLLLKADTQAQSPPLGPASCAVQQTGAQSPPLGRASCAVQQTGAQSPPLTRDPLELQARACVSAYARQVRR